MFRLAVLEGCLRWIVVGISMAKNQEGELLNAGHDENIVRSFSNHPVYVCPSLTASQKEEAVRKMSLRLR